MSTSEAARVVRVASGQGFWGDWLEAPRRQVEVYIQTKARVLHQKARANTTVIRHGQRRGFAKSKHHQALCLPLRPPYSASRTMKEKATMPPASQWACRCAACGAESPTGETRGVSR